MGIDYRKNISVAMKREKADLILKNGKIIDVINLKIIEKDVAVVDGMIVGIGKYDNSDNIVDLNGKYISPGLIDGHVHIESSLLPPKSFSRVSLRNGVTTVIADPHEIANVSGTRGIQFMLDEASDVDLDIMYMLPSCVPSTNFENAGAVIMNDDLKPFYSHKNVLGLAEMMNFPGVLNLDNGVLEKLEYANSINKVIDGHAPGIDEESLNAYITSGISTDHECENLEDVQNRLDRGMFVLIREGTAARNLSTLVKHVTLENNSLVGLCTDDKHLDDLVNEGSIDFSIRKSISLGIDPLLAVRLGTYNTAIAYSLKDRGSITPNKIADFVILDDLNTFKINSVYKLGKKIETSLDSILAVDSSDSISESKVLIPNEINWDIPIKSTKVRTIQVIPNNLYTSECIIDVNIDNNGNFIPEPEINNTAKMFVIERHNDTKNNVGRAIVKDLGIKNGAIATTIAHDSHNLIVVGTNNEDIELAVRTVEKIGGGLVSVVNGKVVGQTTLEIAGLMTKRSVNSVLEDLDTLHHSLKELGFSNAFNPFLTLSFLSLPVIPKLKLTDKGLFDIDAFDFVNIEV